MNKALQLLDTTRYFAGKITYLTGLSAQSYFTRIFRQYTGQGPAAYRTSKPPG